MRGVIFLLDSVGLKSNPDFTPYKICALASYFTFFYLYFKVCEIEYKLVHI